MTTLRREAMFHIVALTMALLAVAAAAPGSAVVTLVLWTFLATAVLWGLSAHGHSSFGPGNAITLARAAAAAALAGLLLADPVPAEAAAAVALAALLADGIDGALARKTALASPFGARFDMEVDALFVLVLSALVVAAGKAGAWALLLGVLRYSWVAGGKIWPPLGVPLPPSERRRFCCGGAVGGLIAALALPPPASAAACAAALAMLMLSFAADLRFVIGAVRR